jgi:hypothetical protein
MAAPSSIRRRIRRGDACLRHHHPQTRGSEYPAVVVPILSQHYTMLQRNLVDTGITRGKRLVVLIGAKESARHGRAQQPRPSPLVEIAGATGRAGQLAVLVEEAAAGLEIQVISGRQGDAFGLGELARS